METNKWWTLIYHLKHKRFSSLTRWRHTVTNEPIWQHSVSGFWTFSAAGLLCHSRIVPVWSPTMTRVCVQLVSLKRTTHPALTEKTLDIQPRHPQPSCQNTYCTLHKLKPNKVYFFPNVGNILLDFCVSSFNSAFWHVIIQLLSSQRIK